VRVFWHDPHDHQSLEYVGLTRRGTPVFVNRLLLDADCVLLCGNVTFHPFAGYSGGPRLIVPGCAGEETIHRHFSHALDTAALPAGVHLRCRDGLIEGNPLQEDSREAFHFITTNFLLHTVLNDQWQIIGAVAGEPLQAFSAGCKAIDNMFGAPISLPSPSLFSAKQTGAPLTIVSCGGHPNDRDFRSAYAALHRATQITRPDGVIIFVAECHDGLGSTALSKFLEEFASTASSGMSHRKWPPGRQSAEGSLLKFYQGAAGHLYHRWFYENELEALIAFSILHKTLEFRIITVTDLPPELAKRLGFIPATSLSEALTLAESCLPGSFSAVLISNGTLLVPRLN
jgi:nickel-dependent lactate racemase